MEEFYNKHQDIEAVIKKMEELKKDKKFVEAYVESQFRDEIMMKLYENGYKNDTIVDIIIKLLNKNVDKKIISECTGLRIETLNYMKDF